MKTNYRTINLPSVLALSEYNLKILKTVQLVEGNHQKTSNEIHKAIYK